VKDFERDMFRSWYAQVAYQIRKYYPKLEVECWTLEKRYKKEIEKRHNGIKFRIFPANFSFRHGMEISFSMLSALLNEQRILDKNEKIILHFHGYHMWQVYLMLQLMDKNKVKVIAQNHGDRSPLKNLRKYKRFFIFLPGILLMQFLENLLFKKVNTFYYLSDEERNYLKKIAPKCNFRFQTMGIEEKYYAQISKTEARKKLGLDKNKKYILYVGRIENPKGIKELIDAAKELDEIEVLIIGDGRAYEKYVNYTNKLKIKNVHFLGAIYGDAKLPYYSAADCLILPSYTEGAPVVIMEAIARNLPVVATNVGGIPKMIKNGKEGILVKVKSKKEIVKAIKEILNWKEKNIRKYAKIYKWKSIIDKTIKDYLGK